MEPVRHTAKLTNLTRACLTVQVLLLERGAVREHGAPLELLSRPDGAFRSLAEESGDICPDSSRPHARRPPRLLRPARPSEEFDRGGDFEMMSHHLNPVFQFTFFLRISHARPNI